VLDALLIGAIAGYAIAIPVGPIAVLILRTGMRSGLRPALAAGAGTATADLVYASVAMFIGPALVSLIAPLLKPARLVAAALLLALAGLSLRGAANTQTRAAERTSVARTYASVLALTLLNPSTVIYFASLAVGLPAVSNEPAARLAFVFGAALASLSWQWLLAGAGSALHGRMPARLGAVTAVVSALIIGALALKIALDALAS
jgi:threonine/homoserine/homoserine lactone efflux protein